MRYDSLRNGIDLGTYTQLAYKLSLTSEFPPYNTILGQIAWGDHAHFVMMIIAPLYKIYPDAITLLFIQLLAITTSAYALYRIAHDVSKNYFYSYAVLFSYLLFFGVQYAIDFDFHTNVFTAAFLAWMFWAFHFKKHTAYWIFFALTLITREDAPLFCVMFGLYLLVFHWKKARIQGLLTLLLAAAYFFVVIYYLIPMWQEAGVPLAYFDVHTPSKTPLSIARAIFGHPVAMLQNMVDTSVKVRTLHNLPASFGYLSLFSPLTYLMAAPNILARFLSGEPQRWGMKLHYSASLVSILSYGAILGTVFLSRFSHKVISLRWKVKKAHVRMWVSSIAALLLLAGTYMVSMRDIDLPIHSLNSERYPMFVTYNRQAADVARSLAKLIPQDDSVATISSFVPMFSNRNEIYNFPDQADDPNADWVILSNQFSAWPFSVKEVNTAIQEMRANENYETFVEYANVFVYKRVE